MTTKTLVLAHYYTVPEVQQMADYVGDSLELAQKAQDEQADRIVFAGVRFMAETAKILNPHAEVILPDQDSSCSLVDQTNLEDLRKWREQYADYVHVAYINSSAQHKTFTDWIVTSRNVNEIIEHLYAQEQKVIFSPDRNMGEYLNYEYGWDMPVWSAVCDVHDKFKDEQIQYALENTDGNAILLAHPESPLPVLKRADFVGSTNKMLKFVKQYDGDATIYVATEEGLLYNMSKARPDLDIQQAPIYSGCACNTCPFMKLNTVELVKQSIEGTAGVKIDYLDQQTIDQAYKPIKRMLDFGA